MELLQSKNVCLGSQKHSFGKLLIFVEKFVSDTLSLYDHVSLPYCPRLTPAPLQARQAVIGGTSPARKTTLPPGSKAALLPLYSMRQIPFVPAREHHGASGGVHPYIPCSSQATLTRMATALADLQRQSM